MQKQESTTMAIINLINYLQKQLGKGETVTGLIPDFTTAFSIVKLLKKLHQMGVKHTQEIF